MLPWVGVLQIEVGCPWARSLKEKRSLLLPLLERWRHGYSLSAVRTAGLDSHDWERFAIAAVDVDRDRLAAVLNRAESAVREAGLELRGSRLDLEPWDPLEASA